LDSPTIALVICAIIIQFARINMREEHYVFYMDVCDDVPRELHWERGSYTGSTKETWMGFLIGIVFATISWVCILYSAFSFL
jgi:hypothetical protein